MYIAKCPHPQILKQNTSNKQWKTIYTFTFGPLIVIDQIHKRRICTSVKITITFLVLFIGEQQDLHYHVTKFNKKRYLPLWGRDVLKCIIMIRLNVYVLHIQCFLMKWFKNVYDKILKHLAMYLVIYQTKNEVHSIRY